MARDNMVIQCCIKVKGKAAVVGGLHVCKPVHQPTTRGAKLRRMRSG